MRPAAAEPPPPSRGSTFRLRLAERDHVLQELGGACGRGCHSDRGRRRSGRPRRAGVAVLAVPLSDGRRAGLRGRVTGTGERGRCSLLFFPFAEASGERGAEKALCHPAACSLQPPTRRAALEIRVAALPVGCSRRPAPSARGVCPCERIGCGAPQAAAVEGRPGAAAALTFVRAVCWSRLLSA